MDSVFVAGSRALSKLNVPVKERLDNIIAKQLTVLVGDANGADKAVQRHLAERHYEHVFVYCTEVCRNNLGNACPVAFCRIDCKARSSLLRDQGSCDG